MKTGGCCLPLHYGGPKAEYFARGALLFYKGSHSLVPPRAAGRTVAVRSVRRAKNKERKGAPYFLVDLKQNTSREGRYCFIRAHIRSCRRERRGELRQFVPSGMQKKKERTRRSSFFGGPAQNRTAVLQGSSADPTRLVGDRSRARKVHRRPFRTHASENRSAAGEVSRRKEFPTGLTPRFRPWADERRRSLKG